MDLRFNSICVDVFLFRTYRVFVSLSFCVEEKEVTRVTFGWLFCFTRKEARMIEFDESIHLECAASDMAFRFIEAQYGRQISERLLYPKPRGRPVGDTYETPTDMGRAADTRADSA